MSEGHVSGSGEQPRLGERLEVTADMERWLRQGQPERRRRPGLGSRQHCRDEPRLPTREANGGTTGEEEENPENILGRSDARKEGWKVPRAREGIPARAETCPEGRAGGWRPGW